MWSQFRTSRLVWIPLAAIAVIAIACGGPSVTSPTSPTSQDSSSGTTPGSGATPAPAPAPAPTPSPGPLGSGTLSVLIKDSPFSQATAVLVTFSEVSAHMSGGDWETLSDAPFSRTCDLKRLQTATDVLGVGTLDAGHYTQLRLTVAGARIYFEQNTAGFANACDASMVIPPAAEIGTAVDIPSGTLKLNREFDVASGGTTTILLDLDGDKSIHQTGKGKYMMTPVIGVVSVQ